MPENNMIDVLYIAGSGRSGSTLLERTLGQLSCFTSVGELRHLWLGSPDHICGCGTPLHDCEFWSPVFMQSFGGIDNINFPEMKDLRFSVDRIRYLPQILNPSLGSSEFRQKLALYKSKLEKLFHAIYHQGNQQIILDSSKDISTLYLYRTIPNLNVHILHLVRDSRGVAYSWLRRSKRRPEFGDKKVYMKTHSPSKIAWEWLYRDIFIQNARKKSSGYTFIRYNDFIKNPKHTIAKILDDLGINDYDLSYISSDVIHINKPNHTVSGNPIRFDSGEIKINLDNEWQNKFDPKNKFIVTLITWPYLLKYGFLKNDDLISDHEIENPNSTEFLQKQQ